MKVESESSWATQRVRLWSFPEFPGVLFGLIGMAPGLRLSTLLGHLHQHLLPNVTSLRSSNHRNREKRVCCPSVFLLPAAAPDSFRSYASYPRSSDSKMSAATESGTETATNGGASSPISADASSSARKQGERLQPVNDSDSIPPPELLLSVRDNPKSIIHRLL